MKKTLKIILNHQKNSSPDDKRVVDAFLQNEFSEIAETFRTNKILVDEIADLRKVMQSVMQRFSRDTSGSTDIPALIKANPRIGADLGMIFFAKSR